MPGICYAYASKTEPNPHIPRSGGADDPHRWYMLGIFSQYWRTECGAQVGGPDDPHRWYMLSIFSQYWHTECGAEVPPHPNWYMLSIC